MAKGSKPIGMSVTVKGGASRATVKFGDVVIRGSGPSAALRKANIARSTDALERAARSLIKPGVAIRAKKGVPLFSVAEGETGVFVRKLDGRTERGHLVDGVFKVID